MQKIKTSENKLDYIVKYNAKKTKQFLFRYNIDYDSEIIKFLENCPNRNGFLRNLIESEIKSNKPVEIQE